MTKTNLISLGDCLPNAPIFNDELSQFPKNAIHLIEEKTGIKSRFFAAEGEKTSDIAIKASLNCLGGFDPNKIGAVICATSTPDRLIPATATRIADAIGAKNAFAFDINSVCGGSCVVLETARAMVSSNSAKTVLAVAADTYSKILNPSNFSSFPYFGDGAAAALVSSEFDGIAEIRGGCFHSDGSGYETITVKAGGSEIPSHKLLNKDDAYFKMNGRAVFEFAVNSAPEVLMECIERFGVDKQNISKVIVHQANIHIVKAISEKTGIPFEKFFTNLEHCGNTAGASTLVALSQYARSNGGRIGGEVLLSSFGGGLTWGAMSLCGPLY